MTRRPRIPGTPRRGTLYVLPSIPDDAPEHLKNGLAIRNQTNVDGVCPDCGATGELCHVPGEPANVLHLVFQHERDCGALTDGEAA